MTEQTETHEVSSNGDSKRERGLSCDIMPDGYVVRLKGVEDSISFNESDFPSEVFKFIFAQGMKDILSNRSKPKDFPSVEERWEQLQTVLSDLIAGETGTREQGLAIDKKSRESILQRLLSMSAAEREAKYIALEAIEPRINFRQLVKDAESSK